MPESDLESRSSPQATVIIVTKNRSSELRNAVKSALNQDCCPQILVIDDASDDDTCEMVLYEFPEVRFFRSEKSLGYIAQRNRGAQLARTPVIFSLDDDALFSSSSIVTQTLAEFLDDRIGAVAIPVVDVNKGSQVKQMAPDSTELYITHTYIGTAHAVRRDLFLALGGYNEFLFHQGEEEDLGIKILDAGYVIRLGCADPIHHFESPKRDFRRMDIFGRRNQILFSWHRVPLTYLCSHLARATMRGIIEAVKTRRGGSMMAGLLRGYRDLVARPTLRNPVSRKTYRLWMQLRRQGTTALRTIQENLPTQLPMAKMESEHGRRI